MMNQWTIQIALAVPLLVTCISPVRAACNNSKNWTESPESQVKVFVGYEEKFLSSQFAVQTMTGVDHKPYPPPLPPDAKEGQINTDGVTPVSYYEPNPRGGWRICRIEHWVVVDAEKVTSSPSQNTPRRPPALLHLAEGRRLSSMTVYLYDEKGRVEQKIPMIVDIHEKVNQYSPDCFRYDDQDRVVLWVLALRTNVCPLGEPDQRDSWNRFRFAERDGETWSLWAENHLGGKGDDWSKTIFFLDGTDFSLPNGTAQADSERGLYHILAGQNIGVLDKSDGPRFKYTNGRVKGSKYEFPFPPVPVSIVQNIEKHLYDYPRRRITMVTSGIDLIEYFKPHQHEVRERFYVGPGGRTLRQEVYDAAGRLKRVINLGFVGKYKDSGGFYDEDLAHAQISLRLKDNKLLYRVWDYDATGKAKLVAIGWNRRTGSAYSGTNNLDIIQMAFGTPDGKQRWKSKEEFFKAFDFDESASRVFPEWRSE